VPRGLDGDPSAVADLDEATATNVNRTDTVTRRAVIDTISDHATPLRGPRATLDIWDQFTRNGSTPDSWDAETYENFITGIDTRLTGKPVTKQPIGNDTDGSTIWAYTAGPVGAPHALMVSGTHPFEALPQYAAMRYFTEFVDHPDMRTQRNRLRLTWVPTLTPSGYMSTRYNSAGVDPARNYDFFWEYWNDPNGHPKGDAPMDQPGPQAVQALLDEHKIACVIDCHTAEAGMWWAGPSTWVIGNRDIVFNAGSRWDQTYNTDDVPTGHYGSGNDGIPQLVNWANKYLHFDKGRHNAAALLIESGNNLGGSTLGRMTREGARLYCGMIDTFLTEWFENGQVATQSYPRSAFASRVQIDEQKPLQEGGTVVNSNINHPVTFTSAPGHAGSSPRTSFDFIVPDAGELVVRAVVLAKSQAENTAKVGVRGYLAVYDTPLDGSSATPNDSTRSVVMLPEGGDENSLVIGYREAVEGPGMKRIQLHLSLSTPALRFAAVSRIRVFAQWNPSNHIMPMPLSRFDG
jgi:hypothetical protein